MSTSLYNGYRAAGDTDLLDLCERARAVLDPVRDRLDAAHLAAMAVGAIDDANAHGTEPVARPLRAAMASYLQEQAGFDPRYTWHDPHRAALWFARDPDSGDIGVLLMAREDAYAEALSTVGGVEPCPYWDGADQPIGVTVNEWEARRCFWDRALPTGRYGDARLQWDLRTSVDDGLEQVATEQVAFVASNAPTRRDRAARLIQEAIVRRAVALDGPERSWPGQVFALLHDLTQAMAGDRLEEILQAADPLLVDITVDVLDGRAAAVVDNGDDLRARFAALVPATWQLVVDELAGPPAAHGRA